MDAYGGQEMAWPAGMSAGLPANGGYLDDPWRGAPPPPPRGSAPKEVDDDCWSRSSGSSTSSSEAEDAVGVPGPQWSASPLRASGPGAPPPGEGGYAIEFSSPERDDRFDLVERRRTLRKQAVYLFQHDDVMGAIGAANGAFAAARQLYRGPHHDSLPDAILLAKLHARKGDTEESRYFLDFAVQTLRRTPCPDPVAQASMLNMVAELFAVLDDPVSAEDVYELYTRTVEDAYGDNHLATSDCYNQVAAFYTHQGRYDRALDLSGRALVIRIAHLGLYNPCSVDNQVNLGLLYRLNQQPHKAIREFQFAKQVYESLFGPDSPHVARVEVSLGFTEHQLGRLAAAHDHYERAFVIRKLSLGPEHEDSKEALNLLNAARIAQHVRPHASSPLPCCLCAALRRLVADARCPGLRPLAARPLLPQGRGAGGAAAPCCPRPRHRIRPPRRARRSDVHGRGHFQRD